MGCYDSFKLDHDINFIDPITNKTVIIKSGYYQTKDFDSCFDCYRITDKFEVEEKLFDYVDIPEEKRKFKWQKTEAIFKGWKKAKSFIGSVDIYNEEKSYVLFVEKGKIFRVIERRMKK